MTKDLTSSKEELFQTLGKHLRQYIKRSEKENLVDVHIYISSDLMSSDALLYDVAYIFEKMYSDKGMHGKFNYQLCRMYAEMDALCIGVVYLNGAPVGYSAIIYDRNNARLWTSAFDFRDESQDSQVLSRAHQRLDWEMLCWCKDQGIRSFDFGGVNSFDEPNGIAQFKMKFGGDKVTYNNYLIPNSLIGRVALWWYAKKRG